MAERNLNAIGWMARCMRIALNISTIDAVPEAAKERYAALAFGTEPTLPAYRQVFEERHGFIPGLSAIDVIMMQGPLSGSFLGV